MEQPTVNCPFGEGHRVVAAFEKDGYAHARCESCGHLWVYPAPTPEALRAFYSEGYFKGDASKRGYRDYDQDKQSVLGEFDRYLSTLAAATASRDLYDIGAATGVFLERAKDRGWRARGIEISAYAAAEAQRKGLSVETGDFLEQPVDGSALAAVTLWDVVEHVSDPLALFRRIRERLASDGVVMFSAPQADSWFARLLGRHWTLIAPPQHLHYFSRKSLAALLDQAGFEAISIACQGKVFDASYLIHFLMGWLKWRSPALERLAAHPWTRRIRMRINPRDVMIVLARKRA